jgi:hypothetical protein
MWQMVSEYVISFAKQTGVTLTDVRLVEGRTVGCIDVYLLHMVANKHQTSLLVYQSDLDALQNGSCVTNLNNRLNTVLQDIKRLH